MDKKTLIAAVFGACNDVEEANLATHGGKGWLFGNAIFDRLKPLVCDKPATYKTPAYTSKEFRDFETVLRGALARASRHPMLAATVDNFARVILDEFAKPENVTTYRDHMDACEARDAALAERDRLVVDLGNAQNRADNMAREFESERRRCNTLVNRNAALEREIETLRGQIRDTDKVRADRDRYAAKLEYVRKVAADTAMPAPKPVRFLAFRRNFMSIGDGFVTRPISVDVTDFRSVMTEKSDTAHDFGSREAAQKWCDERNQRYGIGAYRVVVA